VVAALLFLVGVLVGFVASQLWVMCTELIARGGEE